MLRAKIGQKLDLFCHTLCQVMNANEKSEEIKRSTPVNTAMIRRWSNFIADMKKVLVFWIEDQTSHDIPLSQSLNLSKVLTLIFWRLGEVRELQKRSWKLAAVSLSMNYKRLFHNVKLEGEEATTNVEAVASYLEDLSKLISGDD